MKRQARLAPLIQREKECLAAVLKGAKRLPWLWYEDHILNTTISSTDACIFRGHSGCAIETDVVFAPDAFPFLPAYFAGVILTHPLEQGLPLALLIANAKQVLSEEGTLVISGYHGILKVLSALEHEAFECQVTRFNAGRFPRLNRWLERLVPFLSRGFLIEAKRSVVQLTPLPELHWAPLKARIPGAALADLRTDGQAQ